MPKSREHEPARIKEHLSQRGKEQITNVDNSRTDEKMVTTKPEAEKTEAPKKKKNIIRVYHAQNASDGGKNRPKRQAQDKKPGARGPQAAKAPRNTEAAPKKPAEAVKRQPEAPAAKPAAAGAAGSISITAGAAGKVVDVVAAPGTAVKKGDPVVVLEIMKMETPVVAPQDGTVASVDVAKGETVESGAVLATMNA